MINTCYTVLLTFLFLGDSTSHYLRYYHLAGLFASFLSLVIARSFSQADHTFAVWRALVNEQDRLLIRSLLDTAEAWFSQATREYQRMNTTGATTSDNLADFAEIRFSE